MSMTPLRVRLAVHEMLYHPLHAHEARAFDEHGGVRVERLIQRRTQRIKILEVRSPRSEAARRRLRQRTQCEQLIYSSAPRMRADFRMQLLAGRAKLAHIAEHEQPFAGREHENVDGRGH